MLAKIISGANIGLDAVPITCEVDIASSGLPSLTIVGLADRAVEESKDRVRSAIRNSGSEFPSKKIIINLAPADLPKEGPSYDLPIALGILIASGQIPAEKIEDLKDCLVVGELSLDGVLRRTDGILPLVILAKNNGFRRIILPKENSAEASIVDGIEIFAINSLKELIEY